ncbi:hypothetical protein FA95DRAFT_1586238 [Auriscalpium vulgare]|uniref:Uncharacterized protein n=1 Tax=Auriscalpium vulgare TaxID=40419 RepID=A0ACB8S9A9_9AGAM|nr:hypothetical protein FA95DRAFT_1586238 [Auriscalpium vulgare]
MSCRRQDRQRFIGCHVGSVRVSGCGKGCCGFWGPEGVEENERYHYTDGHTHYIALTQAQGYKGACNGAGRPKYACFTCRRTFKPAWVEGNEYDTPPFSDRWVVRPDRERLAGVWAAWRDVWNKSSGEERRRIQDVANAFAASDYKDMGIEGFEEIKAYCPELWWQLLESRCPGCGATGVRVGDTFRAPAVKDDKGWMEARTLLDTGEEFSYCMTAEEEAELVMEVQHVNARKEGAETWALEKRRRLEALGLVGR